MLQSWYVVQQQLPADGDNAADANNANARWCC
jgi:hypothetical protein